MAFADDEGAEARDVSLFCLSMAKLSGGSSGFVTQ